MSDVYIDYDLKIQDALRQVVRSTLADVEQEGLQGDHHFYIAFKTTAPGVNIPDHLTERYPDEMTIVLQHKFWGLKVFDDAFDVGLTFNQIPSTLTIPFSAIVGFVDPSVEFALHFEYEDDIEEETGFVGGDPADASEAATTDNQADKPAASADSRDEQNTDDNADKADTSDNVVTLDAFRKK